MRGHSVCIHCDPSLKPSYQDGFNEGSHSMFLFKIKRKNQNWPQNFALSGAVSPHRLVIQERAAGEVVGREIHSSYYRSTVQRL